MSYEMPSITPIIQRESTIKIYPIHKRDHNKIQQGIESQNPAKQRAHARHSESLSSFRKKHQQKPLSKSLPFQANYCSVQNRFCTTKLTLANLDHNFIVVEAK